MQHTEKKPRLGRGLEALLGEEPLVGSNKRSEVSLDAIDKSPFQPRKSFEAEEIAALSESIRSHGVLQPLLVRPVGNRYQLIAGERRLRAAELAGLNSVPVTIVDFNDQQSYEAALIENVQRSDLTPIEKAQGFKDYLERYQMTHEQLAQRLGLARPTISNLIGLLDLPEKIQQMVQAGQLTMGHAKVLKSVSDQQKQAELANEVVQRGLSVHALTNVVQELAPSGRLTRSAVSTGTSRAGSSSDGSHHNGAAIESGQASSDGTDGAAIESGQADGSSGGYKTAHVQSIEDQLKRALGLKVEIKVKDKDKGQIVLSFESNDDFERLVAVLQGQR